MAHSKKEIAKELARELATRRRVYPAWIADPRKNMTQEVADKRCSMLADAIEIVRNAEEQSTLFEQKGKWYDVRDFKRLPDGDYLYKSDDEDAFVRISTPSGGGERLVTFFFWSTETNKHPNIPLAEMTAPGTQLYGPIPESSPRESESGFDA